MGRKVISGKFESGNPYAKLETECFRQQVRNNYDRFSGDLGAVREIKEVELTDYRFKDFIKQHPELKTKEDKIMQYLFSKVENAYDYDDEGSPLFYAVDKTRVLGYEVTTFGRIKKINIDRLPEFYWHYLDPKNKTYKLFKMTIMRKVWADFQKYGYEFFNLHEIKNYIKHYVINFGEVYFAIKNNGSRAYMIGPKTTFLKSTKKKSNNKQSVRPVYTVYYVAKVSC